MSDIENLILQGETLVNQEVTDGSRLNNRMHSPVIIDYCSNCVECEDFFTVAKKSFKKMWKKGSEQILFLQNQRKIIPIYNTYAASSTLAECERMMCSYENREYFYDFNTLCVYHIIDTKGMSINEVQKTIKECSQINDEFDRTCNQLVFFIAHSNEMLDKLTNYVHCSDEYANLNFKSCFVISTKSKSGISYENTPTSKPMNIKIYPAIVSTIIVSNNDDRGAHNNIDYAERSALLFSSKNKFFLSFSHQVKPSKAIATQIFDKFIANITDERNDYRDKISKDKQITPMNWQENVWRDRLHILSIDELCQSSDLKPQIKNELEGLQYLPMQEVYITANNDSLANKSYLDLTKYIFEDSLEDFVQDIVNEYCAKIQFSKWLQTIKRDLNPLDLINLSDSTLEAVFKMRDETIDKRLSIVDYIVGYIQVKRFNAMVCQCRNYINSLKKAVEKNTQYFGEFQQNFPMPSDAIGSYYENLANDFYIDTKAFENYTAYVLADSKEDSQSSMDKTYCSYLYQMLTRLVENKRDIFTLSFTKELAQRMNATDQTVAKQLIDVEFSNDLNEILNSSSIMNISGTLDVYLFHTYEGNQRSSLYNALTNVQPNSGVTGKSHFINTGHDDLIEAIRFSRFEPSVG